MNARLGKRLAIAAGLALFLPAAAYSAPPDAPAAPPGQQEMRPGGGPGNGEALRNLRMWKLMQALKLTDAQTPKVLPKIQKMEEARRQFQKDRMEHLKALREAARQAAPDEETIRRSIDAMRKTQDKFHSEEARLFDDVARDLTPRQLADLLLFEERFRREVRQAVRGMDQRPAEGRGPAGKRFGGPPADRPSPGSPGAPPAPPED
ncbi:MAG: hypothetical protein HY039_07360 [Nitrospirae bacterium]|nr:hypothetical protein [Nitrospirota bacterium]